MTKNKIAFILSIIFHPIILPAYFFVFYIFTMVNYNINFWRITNKISFFISLYFSIFTIIIPLIFIFLMLKLKIISSFMIHRKDERFFTLSLIGIIYYLIFSIFQDILSKISFESYFFVIIIILCCTAVISIYYKISIHMISIGSVTSFILHLSKSYFMQMYPIVILLFLISGIVAYSRYILKSHSLHELITGYIIGITLTLYLI